MKLNNRNLRILNVNSLFFYDSFKFISIEKKKGMLNILIETLTYQNNDNKYIFDIMLGK